MKGNPEKASDSTNLESVIFIFSSRSCGKMHVGVKAICCGLLMNLYFQTNSYKNVFILS